MPYLFRAHSAQSQGLNTPTLFAPAAASLNLTTYLPPPTTTSTLPETLQKALAWNTKISSPFTFWTASLFFAVQVARSRQKKGEDNVSITALDVRGSKTVQGGRVVVKSVKGMLAEFGVRLERKGGEEKEYGDIFATMDVLVPGGASRTVDIEVLELGGLYQLYPGFTWGFKRSNEARTRLNRKTEALRAFHFRGEQALTEKRLAVAVGLAMVIGRSKVDLTVLAYLLAFQKRSTVDPVLLRWIEMNTIEVVELDDDEGEKDTMSDQMINAVDLEEVKQFVKLQKLFEGRKISSRALNSMTASVSQSEIDAEEAEWRQWEDQQRQDYRAKKGARPDFDPDFKRRERKSLQSSPGSTSETSSDSSARDAAYAARRASRTWLPREEYRAQTEARRTQPGHRSDRREYHAANPSRASGGALQPTGIYKARRYGSAASRRRR